MLKRIVIYLNEMFPLTSALGTLLTAFSVELAYIRLFNIRPTFHIQMLTAGIVLIGISLLIRIMDEFKDYQDDLRNFPLRPLPSGRVEKSDLKKLGWFCVFLILALSVYARTTFLWSLVALAYTGLMLKWFFIEAQMRKSLPLAFVSHHPIVFINFIYVMLTCIDIYPALTLDKCLYVLPLCFIFTNWEITRKIRAPEQETGYTTYSKIWGPRVAISLSLLLIVIVSATMINIFTILHSPVVLKVLFIFLQGALTYPSLKFLFNLKLPFPLKPKAESQILLVFGFLLLAAIL